MISRMGHQAHQDGPAYYPGVCIMSLGSAAVMRFRRKPSDEEASESGAWGIGETPSAMA